MGGLWSPAAVLALAPAPPSFGTRPATPALWSRGGREPIHGAAGILARLKGGPYRARARLRGDEERGFSLHRDGTVE